MKGKYISLKEAANLSGYAPDYIGYLIRNRKTKGRKIFTNFSWQTTPKEIIKYAQISQNLKSQNSYLIKKDHPINEYLLKKMQQ